MTDIIPIRGSAGHRRASWASAGDRRRHISLDVFLVHPPSEWGVLKLIRTGSRRFSTRVATRLKGLGTPFRDGRILDLATGETIPAPTERDVFAAAKMPYKAPDERHW
ncbi:MAG: hypothetical protein OXH66_10065 [Gemmatimonadetes bacterium]|nr:hypothetical protein [Gemmatimonadota bacterium]